jgi:hypothetical protein
VRSPDALPGPAISSPASGARPSLAEPTGLALDSALVPGLLLLIARDLLLHDPPRVLAWRLLHEPRLLQPPSWLAVVYPRPAGDLDRDPIALLLAALATGLALAYLALALLRVRARARFALIALGGVLLVALPSAAFMAMGAVTDRPYGQDGGVVQLPLALEKILQGTSPYGADYSDSILGKQARASAFWEPRGGNPILHHHAYLPGTHLLMLPFYLLGRVFGFFDPRMVTLLFFLGASLLAPRLMSSDAARLSAAALVALNPLVYWQQVFGANDILIVALLLAVVLLARDRRPLTAGSLLGLACATKQLAWPFAPFVLIHLSGARSLREIWSRAVARRVAGPALAALAVFLAIVAPVATLDFRAFWGDIVRYNVGLPGADNYPLGGTPGFGFANFLIYFGRVTSLSDYFPFAIFYSVLVPLGVALVAREVRAGRAETALVTGSAALLSSLYFSRVVHPNYLVPAAILLPLGALALGLAADVALLPLALFALAAEVAENAVFRSTWDQAVAARWPDTFAGAVAGILPRAGPALTSDPLGLLLSAVAAGLGLVALIAAVLRVSTRGRAGLGVLALISVVGVPTWIVSTIADKAGTVRAQEPWLVQAAADAGRLGRGTSPYTPPPDDQPLGSEAWSTSFRLDPPAELRPDRPLVPPGGAWFALVARALGSSDPRAVLLVAWVAFTGFTLALTPKGKGTTVAGACLLLPLALGPIFGTSRVLTLAALLLCAFTAARGYPKLAAGMVGMAAAVDPLSLCGLPLLALTPGPAAGAPRSLFWPPVLGASALIVPVVLLDPGAFASALVRAPVPGAGLGLVNLLLYAGMPQLPSVLSAFALLVVVALAAAAARRRSGADAFGVAALCSLAWLWLAPAAAADAVAVPVGLLAVGVLRGDDHDV